MELCMAALLATAFAYRNIISLVCVGFVAVGMASAPPTCARLWRVLVRATPYFRYHGCTCSNA